MTEKAQSRFIQMLMLQDRFPTGRVLRPVQALLQLVSPTGRAFTVRAWAKDSFAFSPLVFIALDRDEYHRIHRDVHRTSCVRDDRKRGPQYLRDETATSAKYLILKSSCIGCQYYLTSQRRTT